MTLPYKILAILTTLVVIFIGGFYTGKGQTRVEIQEKVVRVEGESKTVYKDRVVTVTKTVKPDGTTTETTKTEEKEGSKETKTASKDTAKSTVTTPTLSNYSLGLKYWASLDDKLDMRKMSNYEVTVGKRMLGEIWLIGGFRPGSEARLTGDGGGSSPRLDKQVSLGISFNF